MEKINKEELKERVVFIKCPICINKVSIMPLVPDTTLEWFDFHDAVCWKCYNKIHEENQEEMIKEGAIYGKRYVKDKKGDFILDDYNEKILED